MDNRSVPEPKCGPAAGGPDEHVSPIWDDATCRAYRQSRRRDATI